MDIDAAEPAGRPRGDDNVEANTAARAVSHRDERAKPGSVKSDASAADASIFELMAEREHEQIVFWQEPRLGYKGIIAIHDTSLGPALGGTRFWNYANDREAVVDALRLSRGMTYKAAVAGVNLGGGKSVIIGDNKTTHREMIFRAHGRAVESLGGRYITAEDVGTSVDDMEYIRVETEHVVGVYGGSGDPSPVTAYGVYHGIKAAAKHRYGDDALAGRHVLVQGLGHVGYYLCQDLPAEGARLTVTDIDPERVKRVVDDFGATGVEPDEHLGMRPTSSLPAPWAPSSTTTPFRACTWTSWRAPRTISSPTASATPRRSRRRASSTRPTTSSTPAASSTCTASSRAGRPSAPSARPPRSTRRC